MLLVQFVLALFTFLVVLNLVPRFARLALRTGLVDRPGPRKMQPHPVPYGGGLAVGIGVIGTVLAGAGLAWLQKTFGVFRAFPEVQPHLGGILDRMPDVLAVLAGGGAFLLVGMVDDRLDLRPRTKLLAEVLIAAAVALKIEPLSLFLGRSAWAEAVGRGATLVWIVATANMFNLLDHEDGICAGVGFVAGLGLFGVSVITGQLFLGAMLAVLCGGLGGFLVFNFPPAKVYLGDAGSLFVGYLLAVLCVVFTFYEAHHPLYSYFVPAAVMAVPLFDTVVVCGIRLRRGRSIFEADRNHIAHRLQTLGLSKRAAVSAVYGLTLITAIAANLLYGTGIVGGIGIFVILGIVFVLFLVMERAGRRASGPPPGGA